MADTWWNPHAQALVVPLIRLYQTLASLSRLSVKVKIDRLLIYTAYTHTHTHTHTSQDDHWYIMIIYGSVVTGKPLKYSNIMTVLFDIK